MGTSRGILGVYVHPLRRHRVSLACHSQLETLYLGPAIVSEHYICPLRLFVLNRGQVLAPLFFKLETDAGYPAGAE